MNDQYQVRLEKESLVFSAAHFITFNGNVCERLHGHNYRVRAEVTGPLDENHYVIDFIALRDTLRQLVDELDHHMLLPTKHPQIRVTPDEREVWVCDAFNQRMHYFDATVMPPKLMGNVVCRDDPGWITFSLDGRYAYPSSGEVIDVATHKILTTLEDEQGRHVASEKLLEIDFQGDQPVRHGDQFGLGRVTAREQRK